MTDFFIHLIAKTLKDDTQEQQGPVVLATFLAGKSQPLVQVPPNLRSLYNGYAKAYQEVVRLELERKGLLQKLGPYYLSITKRLAHPAARRISLDVSLQQKQVLREIFGVMFFSLMGTILNRNLDPDKVFVQADWMLHEVCVEVNQWQLPLELAN